MNKKNNIGNCHYENKEWETRYQPVIKSFRVIAINLASVVTNEIDLVEDCVVSTKEIVSLRKETVVVDLEKTNKYILRLFYKK